MEILYYDDMMNIISDLCQQIDDLKSLFLAFHFLNRKWIRNLISRYLDAKRKFIQQLSQLGQTFCQLRDDNILTIYDSTCMYYFIIGNKIGVITKNTPYLDKLRSLGFDDLVSKILNNSFSRVELQLYNNFVKENWI